VTVGGSSGGNQKVTQTTKLSPEQRELINLAMPAAKDIAANPPQDVEGGRLAGVNPLQNLAQQLMLQQVGGVGAGAQNAMNFSNFAFTGGLDPGANPYLPGMIEQAVRPVQQQLTQQVLPSIRGQAVQAGQYGGSRQGVAEGNAIQSGQQAAADIGSRLTFDTYQAGLENAQRALALLPQTLGSSILPAQMVEGVGAQRRAFDQQQIDENVRAQMFQQFMPFQISQEIAALAMGLPGGGATSTSPGLQGPNPVVAGLGGAGMGAALGSAIAPGPGTAVGAGLGGLAMLLASR
jgi:hypothetical protein